MNVTFGRRIANEASVLAIIEDIKQHLELDDDIEAEECEVNSALFPKVDTAMSSGLHSASH